MSLLSIRHLRLAVLSVALAPGLLLGAPALAAGGGVLAPLPASDYSVRHVCRPAAAGHASCGALELVPRTAAARAHSRPLGMARAAGAGQAQVCEHGLPREGCLGLRPADLHSAYELPTTASSATPPTIAIVDPFDDPNAEADLKEYDREFGLPPCTRAHGCFKKVNQDGARSPLPEVSGEAAVEISLDIETAHAVCQNCHILLVEPNSFAYSDLEAAESRAVTDGASVISNSWYGPEPLTDGAAFDHPGTVITAAAGDEGYLNWDAETAGERGLAAYPASSPHVVAVGGTRLALDSSGAWQGETLWNGNGAGGSGCSEHFAAPAWQSGLAEFSGVGCSGKRAVADIAADADPYTGVATYDSVPDQTGHVRLWRTLGGTSLGSPLIAASFALAGGGNGIEYPARSLFENAAASPALLHDIAAGSNGECAQHYNGEWVAPCTSAEEAASCSGHSICLAGPGYDGPTGLGTPAGLALFEPAVPAGSSQTITFSSHTPSAAEVGGPAYTAAATSSSGLNVFLTSATPSVCSVSGSQVSFLETGSCTIDANQQGDGEYAPATEAKQSFTVHKGHQLVSFTSPAPTAASVGGPDYTVVASASSGLPVSLVDVTPSVCGLAGATVSFLEAGTCTIEAGQPGDANHFPAAPVAQSFTVAPAPPKAQLIEFKSVAPSEAVVGGATYTVLAIASSGLPVALASATPQVCAIAGSTVSPIGAGICTIDASQEGNSEFQAAPPAQQSFKVAPKPVLVQNPAPASETLSFISSSPPPPAPSPDSSFSVTSRPLVNHRTGAITFAATVANPGTLVWRVTFRAAGRRSARRLFATGKLSVAAAGRLTFSIRPRATASRALAAAAKGHGVLLKATLTFGSSLGGQPTSHTSSIAYRLAR